MSDEASSIEESSSSSRKGSNRLGKVSSHTPMEIFHGGIAFLSVGSSVTAMILSPARMVFIAGAFTSVVGPYAYYQQTKLTDIMALKETHAAITREVDRLESENIRLNETVGKLSSTMDKLEDVEGALDVITQTQGQSVDAFREQVKENREIMEQMRKNHRANMLQNLLQVVIRSDQDDNMQIEEDEIAPLIGRIKKINGVEVMEDRFAEAIYSSGGSLSSVMDIIKGLMANDVPGGEEIFIIKE